MSNKPMLSVERDVIESALECLERCQEQAFQSCECEMCLECGKMPDGCTGTECAKTCQCSTCEHCCNEQEMKELRALLDADKVNSREMGLMQYVEEHPIKPAAQHQGEPVLIQAVAVTREDADEGLRLEWLLEGGIAEMEFPGMVLFAIPEATCTVDRHGVWRGPSGSYMPAPSADRVKP